MATTREERKIKNVVSVGYFSSLSNTPIDNDKIRLTLDTKQLFFETNGERLEITDFIKGMTEEEIRQIIAPLPKLYLASDTNSILIYNASTGWSSISGTELQEDDESEDDLLIWFSTIDAKDPSYNRAFKFNPYSKTFKVENMEVESIKIKDMRITQTKYESGERVIDFIMDMI